MARIAVTPIAMTPTAMRKLSFNVPPLTIFREKARLFAIRLDLGAICMFLLGESLLEFLKNPNGRLLNPM